MRCQGAKQKFTRIYSVIVYSLSPSPLRVRPYTSHCYSSKMGLKDAGHICTPTESLRRVDNEQREGLPLVGKIVGKHVQVIHHHCPL
jgi:hypothetical protein